MKRLAATTLAAVCLTFGVNAFAQTSAPGLTRAEVRAQLIQAERDGLIPANKDNYPPDARTIEHNRKIYAIQHPDSAGTATASQGDGNHPAD